MDNEICGVHGQCLNQPEEDTPDDREYICVCEDGWKGVNCNKYDECYNITCENDGICVLNEDTGNATCDCLPGYYGDRCQYSNPCENNPCEHDGTCVFDHENPPNYTCECKPRYEGIHCEIARECGCINGGVCVELEDEEVCLCPAGYYGSHCENSLY